MTMTETRSKIRTEVYSRISGYFRPTMQWNGGKREEFSERKFVDVKALQMDKRDQA